MCLLMTNRILMFLESKHNVQGVPRKNDILFLFCMIFDKTLETNHLLFLSISR